MLFTSIYSMHTLMENTHLQPPSLTFSFLLTVERSKAKKQNPENTQFIIIPYSLVHLLSRTKQQENNPMNLVCLLPSTNKHHHLNHRPTFFVCFTRPRTSSRNSLPCCLTRPPATPSHHLHLLLLDPTSSPHAPLLLSFSIVKTAQRTSLLTHIRCRVKITHEPHHPVAIFLPKHHQTAANLLPSNPSLPPSSTSPFSILQTAEKTNQHPPCRLVLLLTLVTPLFCSIETATSITLIDHTTPTSHLCKPSSERNHDMATV